jgi:hypothetical protein
VCIEIRLRRARNVQRLLQTERLLGIVIDVVDGSLLGTGPARSAAARERGMVQDCRDEIELDGRTGSLNNF